MNSLLQIETQSLKNLYQSFDVGVDVLRLDKIHPVVSGNKWFKLKEYLFEAKQLSKTTILTYGGAFSNHILATAAACHQSGLQSIGIIRGEAGAQLSPTLNDAVGYGMQLYFLNRDAYRRKEVPRELTGAINSHSIYTISEGGYGLLGCQGAASILQATNYYTHIIAAAGTGTTLAGLVLAAQATQNVMGIPALKNHYGLAVDINFLLPAEKQNHFTLLNNYHFGGYAKYNPTLLLFMNQWFEQTGIPTDFVYTGKLFYALNDLVHQLYFPEGSRLLVIHSGGLQGNRSLKKGTLIF